MTEYSGRIWLIVDEQGKLIDDIDTDMIYHNKYLAITDRAQMGQYTFDNLEGYRDFASKAQKDDIVVVGANFGSGSSRQQAVDCFRTLGVTSIFALSYGAIYKRNAINSGFPILEIEEIDMEALATGSVATDGSAATGGVATDGSAATGDEVTVITEESVVKKGEKVVIKFKQMSKVQKDIHNAGNIFEYAKGL